MARRDGGRVGCTGTEETRKLEGWTLMVDVNGGRGRRDVVTTSFKSPTAFVTMIPTDCSIDDEVPLFLVNLNGRKISKIRTRP